MEKVWTEWLCREYDRINHYYRLRLQRPVIVVREMGGKHGLWESVTRTLVINSSTIAKYPWNEVVDVLKHEMAHQWVTDFGTGEERAHGPAFVLACKRMGLADWAIRARGDLPGEIPDWRQSALSPEEQRLLDRAGKLLALAGSQNEHEAALAVERVREMYAKYNLDQIQARQQAQLVSWIYTTGKKRIERWESVLFSVLDEHFFVRAVHFKQFDASVGEEFCCVEVMGKRENVLMAEYVHSFLVRTCFSLWERHLQGEPDLRGGQRTSARNTYLIGALHGFRAQLGENRKKGVEGLSESESLVLSKQSEAELDAFFRSKYPRVSRKSGPSRQLDRETYEKAKREGRQIHVSKPVSEADAKPRLLPRGWKW